MWNILESVANDLQLTIAQPES